MVQTRQFSSDVPAENPLEDAWIELDGVRFDCKGRLSVLQMSKLASQAISDDLGDAAEAASVYKTLSLAFGPEEYARLEAHTDERNTPDETVLGILQYVNEAMQEGVERITQRPTRPSSSSPTGREGKAALPARSVSASRTEVAVAGGDGQEAAPASKPKPRQPAASAVRRLG
jgi:hypothetical protein